MTNQSTQPNIANQSKHARIIDGKALSQRRRNALADQVQSLADQGVTPCLAAVTVHEDHGWGVYQKQQAIACEAAGIRYHNCCLEDDGAQGDLIALIQTLNNDASIHGIIIQAPLPQGFNLSRAQRVIAPEKDVEGVTPTNLGLLVSGKGGVPPCTAQSAFMLAQHTMGDLRGMEAVVIGHSVNVGKPLGQLLLNAGATLTQCHVDTRDLISHVKRADLVIVAVGRAGLLTGSMIRSEAVVIDVGINRVRREDGTRHIVGDAAEDVWDVASAVTPVPGGVGALTTTLLLEHTVRAAYRSIEPS